MKEFRNYTKLKVFDKFTLDNAITVNKMVGDNEKIMAGFAVMDETLEEKIKEKVKAATQYVRLGEAGAGPATNKSPGPKSSLE